MSDQEVLMTVTTEDTTRSRANITKNRATSATDFHFTNERECFFPFKYRKILE